ncbi:hypothetical protein LCGC14_1755980 [marine sediment metagenome]|uniref:Uncharacterized protein n=1 Tax=marine sediment metagenome TaxID=412755 RepID=A0A0F9JHP3_9ZZZZ
MANQLTRYATVASLLTAGEGSFFGYHVYPMTSANTGEPAAVIDEVRVFQTVLPFRAVVRQIVTEVTTLVAAQFYSVGIYRIDGNSLLVHTGAITTASAAVISTTVTAVTLEPGVYWFAQTADTTTTLTMRQVGAVTNSLAFQNAGSEIRSGTAANSSSSGVLPATLGTITASVSRFPVLALFAP